MEITSKKGMQKTVDFDEFRKVLSKRLKVEEKKLVPEARWVMDVGISSVDMIKILMLIKQKFGVHVPAAKAGKIITVSDAYNLLDKEETNEQYN